jgi:hypothetical protein
MQRFLAGLFLVVLCASLHAQTMNMRATIPFPFHVGDAVMPAGSYIINHSGDVLKVREEAGKHAALLATNAAARSQAPAGSFLNFNRYGENYFLASVWEKGVRDGCAVRKSRAEKEIAGGTSLRESVGIALQRQ